MSLRLTCGLVIYDEVQELQQLIPQLSNELKDYKIDWIFVLNHEQQAIRDWISNWLIQNLKSDFLFFENPMNNLGFARQTILTHSKNELIYLTDPDIQILPQCVDKLIKLSMNSTVNDQELKIAGFSGAVVHKSKHSFLDETFQLMSFLSKYLPFAFQIQNHSHIIAVDHVPACHLLLKKTAALEVGGFSYLQPRCGEDTDFTHRAYNLNFRFLFLPSSQVIHWQNTSLAKWFLKIYNFGKAQIYVQKKNYKKGLRYYRLIPLVSLFIFSIGLFISKIFFLTVIFTLFFFFVFNRAFFGFFLVLLSYSLGEMSELIWPFFELKNEVPLQVLKANLTSQSYSPSENNILNLEN